MVHVTVQMHPYRPPQPCNEGYVEFIASAGQAIVASSGCRPPRIVRGRGFGARVLSRHWWPSFDVISVAPSQSRRDGAAGWLGGHPPRYPERDTRRLVQSRTPQTPKAPSATDPDLVEWIVADSVGSQLPLSPRSSLLAILTVSPHGPMEMEPLRARYVAYHLVVALLVPSPAPKRRRPRLH